MLCDHRAPDPSREKSVPDIDAEFAQSRPALATFDDLQAQLAADIRRSAASEPADPRPSEAVDEQADPQPNSATTTD